MILSDVISKSYYGSVGYVENENDISRLEQYIVYNLPILNKFKGVIMPTETTITITPWDAATFADSLFVLV